MHAGTCIAQWGAHSTYFVSTNTVRLNVERYVFYDTVRSTTYICTYGVMCVHTEYIHEICTPPDERRWLELLNVGPSRQPKA